MSPNSYSEQRQTASCEDCVRLWKEYADLNREFLKAAADREAASAAGDPAASFAADSRYRQAGERRLKARKAVASHKALRHPNVGPARVSTQQSFSPTAG
jgi:hypothetical protein